MFLRCLVRKTISLEIFVYSSHFTLLCFKTIKLMKKSQYRESKVKLRNTCYFNSFWFYSIKPQKKRQNTHFVEWTEICQKQVILVYFSILCTKTQKCRWKSIFVKVSNLYVFKVFCEKKLSRMNFLGIQVILHSYALKRWNWWKEAIIWKSN